MIVETQDTDLILTPENDSDIFHLGTLHALHEETLTMWSSGKIDKMQISKSCLTTMAKKLMFAEMSNKPNIPESGKTLIRDLKDLDRVKRTMEKMGYESMLGRYIPPTTVGISWYGIRDCKTPMEFFYVQSKETFKKCRPKEINISSFDGL